MQRQSFDFQLTELPIRPALISHALPLRPAVLKVKALTHYLPVLPCNSFSGTLSSGYCLTCCNKQTILLKQGNLLDYKSKVIHKSKVHYNFTCVVLSEYGFTRPISVHVLIIKQGGKKFYPLNLRLTLAFNEIFQRVGRNQNATAKDGHDTVKKTSFISLCASLCWCVRPFAPIACLVNCVIEHSYFL